MRHGEIFLHVVEFLRVDVGRHIVLAVDHAGLQRLIEFAEGDDLRNGAELPRHGVEHL
jgi:hypothetical protein